MNFGPTIRKMSDKTKAALRRIEYQIWRTRAFRRFFLDDLGNVKTEAVPVMKWLRYFCHVDRPVYKAKPDGTIDPFATHVAAGRQEVYQELMRLLGVDERKLREQMDTFREEDYNP